MCRSLSARYLGHKPDNQKFYIINYIWSFILFLYLCTCEWQMLMLCLLLFFIVFKRAESLTEAGVYHLTRFASKPQRPAFSASLALVLWKNITLPLFFFNMDTGNWLRSPHMHSKLLPNETIYLLDSVSLYEPRMALNSCSFCFSMYSGCMPPCKAFCHVLCSIYSSWLPIRNHELWKKFLNFSESPEYTVVQLLRR